VKDLKLSDLRELITVKKWDTLPTAFKALTFNNILSAPVLNSKGHVRGFIDMMDITRYAVYLFGSRGLDLTLEKLKDLMELDEIFMSTTVSDVIKSPFRRRWHHTSVGENNTVYYAFENIIMHRLHRLAVLDESGHPVNLITQTGVVKFLLDHLDLVGERRRKPVGEMSGVMNPVHTVSDNTITLVAFNLLVEKNIHGAAVLDKFGTIKGTLSVRDIKGIMTNGTLFSRLFLPVSDYVAYLRDNDRSGAIPRHPVVALASDPLEKVLRQLQEHKIHRVFIVKSLEKLEPIGVVSISDILNDLMF
jgi:CBS domain-containing protein